MNPWAPPYSGTFAGTGGRRSMHDHCASSLSRAERSGHANAALLPLLALIVVSVLPATSNALPTLSASANGSTGVVFERQLTAGDLTPVTVTQTPTATSITLNATGSSFQSQGPPLQPFGGGATASATVVVGFGALGAEAAASQVLSPLTIGSPQIPPVFTNPFDASASISASGAVQDSFVLTDPTRPPGAPVTFNLSSNLDATMSGFNADRFFAQIAATPFLAATGSFGFAGLSGSHICIGGGLGLDCLFATAPLGSFQQVTGKNGEVVSLLYGLGVDVEFLPLGSAYVPNLVAEGVGTMQGGVNAISTMTVNIDPVTPGLSIISASGHDYSTLVPPPPCGVPNSPPCSQGVPEPVSLLLLGSGLAGLAGFGWWRNRQA